MALSRALSSTKAADVTIVTIKQSPGNMPTHADYVSSTSSRNPDAALTLTLN